MVWHYPANSARRYHSCRDWHGYPLPNPSYTAKWNDIAKLDGKWKTELCMWSPSSRPECDPERTDRGCEPWGTESHQIAQFLFFTRDPHPEISHGWSAMCSCRCVPSSVFASFCLSWILSSSVRSRLLHFFRILLLHSCCVTTTTSCSVSAQLYVSEETYRTKRHLLQLVGPGHTGMSGPAFGICICPETVRNAHTGTSSPDQLWTYCPLRVSRLIIWETWRIAPILNSRSWGLVLY